MAQTDPIANMDFSSFIQGYWRLADWNMSDQELVTFINEHVEVGIDWVDHADIYGDYRSEALFGKALKLDASLRSQINIVTKCGIKLCSDQFPERKINHYDTSAKHIQQSVDNSLTRLHTDYIDCLLIHRPDALMNADEVAQTFQQLYLSGKVLSFGVSNFTPSQFELLQSRMDHVLITNQVELNPLNMDILEDGTMDHLQGLGIRPMIWSALAGGGLFYGKTNQFVRIRNELKTIAGEIGAATIDQVLYAWIRMLPVKPAILLGTGKIERIRSAIRATELTLNNEQWYRIWVAAKGHGVA